MLKTKKTQISREDYLRYVAVIVLFVLEIASAGWFYHEINYSMNNQVVEDLHGECNKATIRLNNLLNNRLEWATLVSELASLTSKNVVSIDQWWEILETYEKDEGYYVGIIDGKGNLYEGDHTIRNVSEHPVYLEMLEGKAIVSNVTVRPDGQRVVVLISPIRKEDTITGAFEVEYTVTELGKIINPSGFKNSGYNMVIDSDGNLVATHKDMLNYDTFYEMFADRKDFSPNDLEIMKENVKNGKEGVLEYRDGAAPGMLYYQPVGINGWTMVSIGSPSHYGLNSAYVRHITVGFLAVTFVIYLLASLLIIKILRKKIKALRKASIDGLTGLYTRTEGMSILEKKLNGDKTPCFGCLFLDLDDFKTINDTMGHEEGDRLLSIIGQVIETTIRTQDIAYRFGGDEFIVWLFGEGNKESILTVAERIKARALEEDAHLTFSIGATLVEKGETDKDVIIKRTDLALYEAKNAGRNCIRIR